MNNIKNEKADDWGRLMDALSFAAVKHQYQKRKDGKRPYINHVIRVSELLWKIGDIRDINILAAALLHDTVEDTDTTPEELTEKFGAEVCSIVLEVTDDKDLPKQMRKDLQIEHAPHLSREAGQIKLADKICNIEDILLYPPDWSIERKRKYIVWARKVISRIRGANDRLEQHFDEVCERAGQTLGS